MKAKFNITKMGCSGCANKIEKTVSKMDGVKTVAVSLIENLMTVEFEGKLTTDDIIKTVTDLGYGAAIYEIEKPINNISEHSIMKNRAIYSILFAIPLFYVAAGEMLKFPLPDVLFQNTILFVLIQILLLLPIVIINFNYFKTGVKNLFKMSPDMSSLISIGSGAAIVYSLYSFYKILSANMTGNLDIVEIYRYNLYFDSAGVILAVVTLGKFLEFRAKENTKNAIKKLTDLTPKTATVIRDGVQKEIEAKEVQINDTVIVKSGQIIPTDGVIEEGKCTVDESMVTGESMPVTKSVSDNIIGGTINQNGHIKFKATKIGEDTTLAQIIKLVENTNSTKAPIGRTADVISSFFVPVVITLSALTFIVWLLLGKDIGFALSNAVCVLVISCPCALGLATPAAIMTGSGVGARNGILFKNAEILEKTHSIDTVVLDKTGTITEGHFGVNEIIPTNKMTEDEILKFAASIENLSNHPIARAVLNKATGADLLNPVNFEELEGAGLKAEIDGHSFLIGNKKLMEDNNINLPALDITDGKIPVYLSQDGVLEGVLTISDTVKKSSIEAVQKLKEMGIKVIMLTGDNRKTAENIAKTVGVDDFKAEILPQDKEEIVRKLQEQNKKVIMAGDGINDAPALNRADIGIAIGSGSDIAIDCGDVVLVKNNLIDIVNAIKISGATTKNIKENLFWALFYNSIAIPVAMGCFNFMGLTLNPMIAAIAMGCSSLFVVCNALRLQNLKLEKTATEGKSFRQKTTCKQ